MKRFLPLSRPSILMLGCQVVVVVVALLLLFLLLVIIRYHQEELPLIWHSDSLRWHLYDFNDRMTWFFQSHADVTVLERVL